MFDGSATPDSIRVNAGQLDRLFDMLAELVMLRNRRDSNVGHLKRVNAELLHCVSRLRSLAEHVPSQAAFDGDDDVGPIPISSLTEIASDMLELGRTLRQTIDPITEEKCRLPLIKFWTISNSNVNQVGSSNLHYQCDQSLLQ